MGFSLSTLLAVFQEMLALPTDQGGLGIPLLLGYPDLAQSTPVYPLAALTFEEDDFYNVSNPAPRLGQVPRGGTTISVTVALFANSEMELLDLVDRMRGVRERVAGVTADACSFRVTYAATKRENFDPDTPALRYVTTTGIKLSTV